jgi:probable phosphoglycerate mutase
MAANITIVRHGETEWNVQKRIQGQHNSNLTNNGVYQAKLAAEALKKRDFDVLISSDLGRAVDTAKIINKQLNLEHMLSSGLRERSFGIAEGKTYEEIKKIYPVDFGFYIKRNPKHAFKDGESLTHLYNRVVDEINNIAEKYNGQNVLIVSHGLVLEMMMYKTFNREVNQSRVFSINNSSINTFTVDNNNWFLKEWGVIEHIISLNVLNEL